MEHCIHCNPQEMWCSVAKLLLTVIGNPHIGGSSWLVYRLILLPNAGSIATAF